MGSKPVKPTKPPLRVRLTARRNRLFADPRFQYWVARLPLINRLAKARAGRAFDVLAGFTYSQILHTCFASGLFDILADGPLDHRSIAAKLDLSAQATLTVLRAARALELSEEPAPDHWMLGELGAVLAADQGIAAMVHHNRLLYADLADPLDLLRRDRQQPTELSRYWSYAGALHGAGERGRDTAEYSQLMASSQHFVADQVLGSFRFPKNARLLDVGGGHGAFLSRMGAAHPDLHLGLFDLPEVAKQGAQNLIQTFGPQRVSAHQGNFFQDPIPPGYDIVSLVRILHDHDDEPAHRLLANIRASLAPGARLLIAEPMAQTPGAHGMGEAYFGMYLWAMGSGRPRSRQTIAQMALAAGFARIRFIATAQPVNASIVVATA